MWGGPPWTAADALVGLSSFETRRDEVAVHPRDHFELDFFGTRRFALADVGAAPESLGVELPHHLQGTLRPLRLTLRQQSQVRNLRARKQRRRRIRTRRYARSASNARRRIHRAIGIFLGHEYRVAIWSAARGHADVTRLPQ